MSDNAVLANGPSRARGWRPARPARANSLPKLSPPKLFGASPRPRLFEQLDALRDHPVIWVGGFPGAGKTTLLASYCDARKLPALWYQVDSHDSDAAEFFHHLSLGASQAQFGKRFVLPALEPQALHDLTGFSRRYFRALFAALPRPTLLVFDNFNEALDASSFHTAIGEALVQVPEGINVILISRGRPPQELARLRATNALGLLPERELRLTLEEARSIAGAAFPDSTIAAIHERCDGWVSGLVLAMANLRAGEAVPEGLGGEAKDTVFDFFAGQLFCKASPEIQQLLLRTAFLRRFTARMAEMMTGSREAGRLLDHLYRNHLFTYRKDGTEPIYQYHALLRDFLAARALEHYGKDERLELAGLAGELLQANGQFEDAVDCYLAAELWPQAAGVVVTHASHLIAEGRGKTVRAWIAAIPRSIKEANPWLCYWNGVAVLEYDLLESRSDMERAFAAFNAEREERGALLAWSWITRAIVLDGRERSRLDQWIAWLDAQGPDLHFPDTDTEAHVTASMATALFLRQPERDDLSGWMERAFHGVLQSGYGKCAVLTAFQVAHYHFHTGDPAKVKLAAHWCAREAADPHASPLAGIVAALLQAYGSLGEGDVAAARVAVALGLELAGSSGIRMLDHFLDLAGIYCSLGTGDWSAAGRLLERRVAAAGGLKEIRLAQFHYLSAAQALQSGDVAAASEHARMAVDMAEPVGSPRRTALYRSGYLQILHERGRLAEVHEQLEKTLPIAVRVRSGPIQAVCLLVKAQLAFDCAEASAGLDHLREAFANLAGRGMKFVQWWWRPRLLADLCVRALDANIEPRYVRELIRALRLVPSEPPLACERWPWAIRIRTLGAFEVEKDERPLSWTGKAQQRPLEMLRLLVALGGEGVAVAGIAAKLWPEAEGDSAHRAFDVTLHRLRKLLGSDSAIALSDGRLSLDPHAVWVDALAFTRLVEERCNGMRDGPACGEECDLIAERAFMLYRGHFLEHEDEQPWMLAMRERLRQKFRRLIARLGQCWEQRRQWARAERLYRRALELDPLAEGCYQCLMVCQREQGRVAEALEVYRRCRHMLSVVLGVSPSGETQSLYASLKNI